jgi:hypothetical protein
VTGIFLKKRLLVPFLGCNLNEKKLLLEEERGNMWEKTMDKANPVSGFRLGFLGKDENQMIHKVEVRNINFQDLMRHLRRGESVLIIPKFRENSLTNAKKQEDRTPWYFAHI